MRCISGPARKCPMKENIVSWSVFSRNTKFSKPERKTRNWALMPRWKSESLDFNRFGLLFRDVKTDATCMYNLCALQKCTYLEWHHSVLKKLICRKRHWNLQRFRTSINNLSSHAECVLRVQSPLQSHAQRVFAFVFFASSTLSVTISRFTVCIPLSGHFLSKHIRAFTFYNTFLTSVSRNIVITTWDIVRRVRRQTRRGCPISQLGTARTSKRHQSNVRGMHTIRSLQSNVFNFRRVLCVLKERQTFEVHISLVCDGAIRTKCR